MTSGTHSRIGTPLALTAGFLVLSVAFRLAGAAANVALLGAACCIAACYAWTLESDVRRRRAARRAEVKVESRSRKPRRRQD